MPVKKSAYFVGALAGGGIAVAAFAAGAGMKLPAVQAHGAGLVPVSAPMFSPPPGAPMSFADIFARVSPAVVSIHVTSPMNIQALRKAIPGLQNFPFDLVPKGQDGNGDEQPAPKQESSGSGFFISPDGYIVTNNHVVDGAQDIKVVTKDGTELKATVVGRDEGTDLAVLKVEGHDFPFVSFETQVKPRVGDWVVAVGNPFDLEGTATAGIVSAYNRDLNDNFVDYIQIDAPINRGNSGGPTFDVYGRVIGVNSEIYSPNGGSIGIGFAIPADIADQVAHQLIAHGKVVRGYIGATIQNLSGDLAESWGMAGRKGAQVTDLVPGGPAQRAGLLPGDVVVAVDGSPVKTNLEMTRDVAKAQAGDIIRLDVFRDGKERTIDIRSGTRPPEDQLALNGAPGSGDEGQGGTGAAHPAAGPAVLGMQLAPLTAATRGLYSIPDNVKTGVVVQSAKDTCDVGGDNCLQRGDVIVQAGDRQVASTADVAAAVAEWRKAGRVSIPLGVRRAGQTTAFVPIKIEG
ncbi:MAG TPA: trypsin-like peptidase domain-containing protein [Caulobacteraceae bacterium]|nr:trypsin-like peptidase domain-containing protein [Caulobacteraceae bacterium]